MPLVDEAIAAELPARPLCSCCLEPVDPLEHDCPRCGEAVGTYTPYIPFVNIRFRYNFLGRVWKRVWEEGDHPLHERCACFLFLVVVSPSLVLIGLPFVFFGRR